MNNMEQIIGKIVEIEKKADEIVSSAAGTAENIDEYLESESGKLRDKIMNKAAEAAEKEITSGEREFYKTLSKLDSEYNEKLEYINAQYKQNKEKWIMQIYDNVMGG